MSDTNTPYEKTIHLSGAVSSQPWIILPKEYKTFDFEMIIPVAGEGYFETTSAPLVDVELSNQGLSPGNLEGAKWARGNVDETTPIASRKDTYRGSVTAFKAVNVSDNCYYNVRGKV